MNQSLITKWIWKIQKGSKELWFRLLDAKYMKGKGFFGSPYNGTSQFWRDLHKVKHLFQWGAKYNVTKGDRIDFGMMKIGGMPLKFSLEVFLRFVRKQMQW